MRVIKKTRDTRRARRQYSIVATILSARSRPAPPQDRLQTPSSPSLHSAERKERDDLSQMAERVFGESQGDWVHNKVMLFGGTGLVELSQPPASRR